MRLALACLVAAAVACGLAVDVASAALPNKGVLSMTPARRTLTTRPPVHLTPTRVSNSTELEMNVTVFPTLLVQELDGTFGFNEDARDLAAARLQFGVTPSKFTLKPNQERNLDLHWQTLPRTARAGYYGLLVQGVPVQKGKGVGSVLRLLGINFFSLPGGGTVDGKLTGLRGEQAAPRVLRFFPRVKNTGKRHEQPANGHCKVQRGDQTGPVVLKNLKYGAGVVLPGFEREYPIVLKKPTVLPAGSYVLRCSQRFGKQMSTKDLPFRLSGPNTLPTAALKLRSVSASGEIDGSAKVGAVVRNVGSKAAVGVLRVRVDRIPVGARPVLVARGRFPQGSIGAGDAKKPSMTLGKLTRGNYRVTVTLASGGIDLDQKTADFAATVHQGFFDKLKDWWWLLLVILALLVIAWFVWRQRKKQQELEKELAQAQAATLSPKPEGSGTLIRGTTSAPDAASLRVDAPPAPEPKPAPAPAPKPPPAPGPAPASAPPGDRVNINTAGVEELMQLSGVGRRAAERIIAHRVANGPFASVGELSAVEGWHAERIRRIADSATT